MSRLESLNDSQMLFILGVKLSEDLPWTVIPFEVPSALDGNPWTCLCAHDEGRQAKIALPLDLMNVPYGEALSIVQAELGRLLSETE